MEVVDRRRGGQALRTVVGGTTHLRRVRIAEAAHLDIAVVVVDREVVGEGIGIERMTGTATGRARSRAVRRLGVVGGVRAMGAAAGARVGRHRDGEEGTVRQEVVGGGGGVPAMTVRAVGVGVAVGIGEVGGGRKGRESELGVKSTRGGAERFGCISIIVEKH